MLARGAGGCLRTSHPSPPSLARPPAPATTQSAHQTDTATRPACKTPWWWGGGMWCVWVGAWRGGGVHRFHSQRERERGVRNAGSKACATAAQAPPRAGGTRADTRSGGGTRFRALYGRATVFHVAREGSGAAWASRRGGSGVRNATRAGDARRVGERGRAREHQVTSTTLPAARWREGMHVCMCWWEGSSRSALLARTWLERAAAEPNAVLFSSLTPVPLPPRPSNPCPAHLSLPPFFSPSYTRHALAGVAGCDRRCADAARRAAGWVRAWAAPPSRRLARGGHSEARATPR